MYQPVFAVYITLGSRMRDLGMRKKLLILALVAATGCSNQRSGDSGTYTLYRSSVVAGIAHVHVATFDAKDGDAYNRENCELTARFFSVQPSIETRFWCEPGFFRQDT